MRILPDKPSAVEQVKTTLRPGGRFGLSDVTLEPVILPQGLNNVVGPSPLPGRRPECGWICGLADVGGMTLRHQADASQEIIKLLDDLEGKLGMLVGWWAGRASPNKF